MVRRLTLERDALFVNFHGAAHSRAVEEDTPSNSLIEDLDEPTSASICTLTGEPEWSVGGKCPGRSGETARFEPTKNVVYSAYTP